MTYKEQSVSNLAVRTAYFASRLPRAIADKLNQESGRIYTQVMVEHYRIFRKKGIWLSAGAQERYNDFLNADRPKLLHAHSIDAAQQGFPKACKVAKANREEGAKYPHWRKRYRTTVWKNTALRLKGECLILALARGQAPLAIKLPENLRTLPQEAFVEARLVYNKARRHYEWHLVIEAERATPENNGHNVMSGDLGEIHPIALSDGQTTTIISARELRSVKQYTNKRLAEIATRQSRCTKYSRNWWQLQRRKNRFLEQQALRVRDIEHQISHEVIEVAQEAQVKALALGDVRDVADGKRLNTKSQQKISNWSHGKLRRFITFKAHAVGIEVHDKVNEAYTSQTCPSCGNRYKPKGRTYRCANPACGLVAHRDGVGAVNILSRFLYDELAKLPVPAVTKYRHPVLRGKRSPVDTRQVDRNALIAPSENCEVEDAQV